MTAPLPYATDAGWSDRAAFGLVVLQVDETIEQELPALLAGPPTRLYHARIPSGDDLTAETIARMADDLPASVRLLPPAVHFAAIAYACTSGAAVLGEDRVAALVNAVRPGVPVTNPLTALKAACRALGVGRLALVSPYVAEVSDALRARLDEAGIATAAFASFDQRDEATVARIAPTSVLDAVTRIGAATEVEAVFVSCTNLRVAAIAAEAESRLGRPVLYSNQVLAWHLLRLAGIADALPGRGALFETPLA